MSKLNLNEIAQEIAKSEGKAKEVNIAQIKEILKITLIIFGKAWQDGNEIEIIRMFKKYSEKT